MKDFDAVRRERADATRDERTFTLGGQEFLVKASIKPEALTAYESLQGNDSATRALEVIDDLIVAFIEEDGHARYRELRKRTTDPIGLVDLQDLVEWLVETQTKRPTGRPGSSTGSPGPTGDTSTESSSSPVTAAA